MRRKVLLPVVAGLTLTGAIIVGYFWYWQGTPRHSLYQMVRAIQNKDMNKFYHYVDLKAIFNNLIKNASQEVDIPGGWQEPDTPEDDWNRWSRELGEKFARFLLPKLFDAFEAQIKAQVENYLLSLSTSETLGLTALVAQAQIEQQGHQAQVTIIDPQTNKPFRFWMQQDPQTRKWRVVEVNYQDLKEIIKRELQG